jgi:hypothetical protein
MSDIEQGGVSRRDLMKRSAVIGGALVWATPVVQSVTAPAFAGTPGEDGCPEGKVTHRFKFQVDEDNCENGNNVGGGCSFPGWDEAEPGDCDHAQFTFDPDTNCMTIVFPEACRAETASAVVKTGGQDDKCYDDAEGGKVTVTASNNSITVCLNLVHDISFVAVLICCLPHLH